MVGQRFQMNRAEVCTTLSTNTHTDTYTHLHTHLHIHTHMSTHTHLSHTCTHTQYWGSWLSVVEGDIAAYQERDMLRWWSGHGQPPTGQQGGLVSRKSPENRSSTMMDACGTPWIGRIPIRLWTGMSVCRRIELGSHIHTSEPGHHSLIHTHTQTLAHT